MAVLTPRFGISIVPNSHKLGEAIEMARAAEAAGLDFVSVLDHPYNPVLGEAWTMITAIATSTNRISVQLAVACMPLRQPAILAKQVATLQRLVGPRIEIGLGAGAALDGVASYGGPVLTRPQSFTSLTEQVKILNAMWGATDAGNRDHRVGHYEGFGRPLSDTAEAFDWNEPISFEGVYHRLESARPGPVPSEHIPLFIGGYGPKMVRMAAELTDGIAVSHGRMTRDELLTVQTRIDTAADEFGRDKDRYIRGYNLFGTIAESEKIELGGRDGMSGSVTAWADLLADHLTELRFNTIQYFPHDDVSRMRRFAEDVVPATRALLPAIPQ